MFSPTRATSLPSPTADGIDELQRMRAVVADSARRVAAAAQLLPAVPTGGHWWGPARDALQIAIDTEREQLVREAVRLEAIARQLAAEIARARDAMVVDVSP